ncbi:MAG: hypothetical protein O7I93_10570 [Gemmatimonadetes bacterium]|nr:hypothetical protein [Gemmatimonadota bacterium]
MTLHDTFGDIDIYLFDQLLKDLSIAGRHRSFSGRSGQVVVFDGGAWRGTRRSIKTTNVQDQRCMTTWVVRKGR